MDRYSSKALLAHTLWDLLPVPRYSPNLVYIPQQEIREL
jgi:hypothetical protein